MARAATCSGIKARSVVAITHDRYFLDNVAGWILELDRGAGAIPWEGNYSVVARFRSSGGSRWSRSSEDTARQRTLAIASWSGSRHVAASARQAKSQGAASTAYEELAEPGPGGARSTLRPRSYVPPGPRLGDVVVEFAQPATRAYGDRLPHPGPVASPCRPAGIVGVIGRERGRQDHPVPDDRGRRDARRRHA